MSDIPEGHNFHTGVTAGRFITRKLLRDYTANVTDAIIRDFCTNYWTDVDWISLGTAWDRLIADHGEPNSAEFSAYIRSIVVHVGDQSG